MIVTATSSETVNATSSETSGDERSGVGRHCRGCGGVDLGEKLNVRSVCHGAACDSRRRFHYCSCFSGAAADLATRRHHRRLRHLRRLRRRFSYLRRCLLVCFGGVRAEAEKAEAAMGKRLPDRNRLLLQPFAYLGAVGRRLRLRLLQLPRFPPRARDCASPHFRPSHMKDLWPRRQKVSGSSCRREFKVFID